jgi:ABC-2 type transport system permease protein
MRQATAIAGRELRASLLAPGPYVVIALFCLATGWFFCRHVFNAGELAALRPVFAFAMLVFCLVCPAITMRAVSEEVRLGTIEVLMASPVSSGQIIVGKFLGAMGFLLLLLAPTLVYVLALEIYGRPDYGEVACGYLGLVLAGAAFLAAGTLASTLTANQVVAYLITVFFWILLILVAKGLPQSDLLPAAGWSEPVGRLLAAIDPDLRLRDFAIGLFDTANVVYFASICVVMLIAATLSLETRRWR